MIPVMNGHNAPSPPSPLLASAAQRPWAAALLLLAGMALDRCAPLLSWAGQRAVEQVRRCPDPVRTVEAKDCNPPCPAGQVCHKGDCVKVAADRQMTLASQPDEPTRVILEIRAR